MNDIIEARIANLEAQIAEGRKKLELELKRAAACMQVQNALNRFLFAFQGKDADACVAEFADSVDISFEIYKFGVYKSKENIKRLLREHYYMNKDIPGAHIEMNSLTPCIVVAGDGETAKGVWSSFGWESAPTDEGVKASWNANQIGVEFIYENGAWKIRYLQVFTTFVSDYRKSWTAGEPDWYKPEFKGWPKAGDKWVDYADGATTFYRPYDQKIPRLYWPQTPQPYYTYDNSYPMVGTPPEGADL
jgi:hypothetical protein